MLRYFTAAWTKESTDSPCFHKQTQSCEAPRPFQPRAAAAAREVNIKSGQSANSWLIITHTNMWEAKQQIRAKSQYDWTLLYYVSILSALHQILRDRSSLLTSLWAEQGWERSEWAELRAAPHLILNCHQSELSATLLFNLKDREHLLHVRLAVSLVLLHVPNQWFTKHLQAQWLRRGEQREKRLGSVSLCLALTCMYTCVPVSLRAQTCFKLCVHVRER